MFQSIGRFRGRRVDGRGWVIGSAVRWLIGTERETCYIIPDTATKIQPLEHDPTNAIGFSPCYPIKANTLGELVCELDGCCWWEGDIVTDDVCGLTGVTGRDNNAFFFKGDWVGAHPPDAFGPPFYSKPKGTVRDDQG